MQYSSHFRATHTKFDTSLWSFCCSFIITALCLGIKPVCAFFVHMCHIRPLQMLRPWGLQFLSCWRTKWASPVAAHLCLTPLVLTLLLTLSLSVTTLTCRCVSLFLLFSLSFSFSISKIYQCLVTFHCNACFHHMNV